MSESRHPPPGFEGIAAAGLFLTTAVYLAGSRGVAIATGEAGVEELRRAIAGAAYLLLLSLGAFRVRAREGQEYMYRVFVSAVALQGLCYAALALRTGGRMIGDAPGPVLAGAMIVFTVATMFGCATLLVAAHRATLLVLTEFFGPLGLALVGGVV